MFDRINKIIPAAFDSVTRAARPNADADVDLYDSLDESDFVAIASKYGGDEMVNYVESMERRKLKRGE